MTRHHIAFHTFLLSLLHLLVDGICACGLMLILCHIPSYIEACGLIVLYDVLAFGTQPLTGNWVDRNGNRGIALKLSIALLVVGVLISFVPAFINLLTAIVCAILLGMGNSLFHVYGGKYVAIASRNDIRVMGVFVSTGAVGLAIGLGFSNPVLLTIFLFALLVLFALHLCNAEPVGLERTLSICTLEAKQTSNQTHSCQMPFTYVNLYSKS